MNWIKKALATVYGKEGSRGVAVIVAVSVAAIAALVWVAVFAGIDLAAIANSIWGIQ